MEIQPPVPLASLPTVAIGSLDGYFPVDLLREATCAGFAPVLLHQPAGEAAGPDSGPREALAATVQALDRARVIGPWGAGCAVGTTEEAVLFATAGYTWFTLNLTESIDARADSMSLDELDAAIVALEDSGCYTHDWHNGYLDREWCVGGEKRMRIGDEVLARAAVKFGTALAHADQLHQAIRTSWVGRGGPPDVELNFSASRLPTSTEEFLFLALESARRGLSPAAIAPSLGPSWQPGAEFAGSLDMTLRHLGEIATIGGSLKIGVHFAAGKPGLIAAARSIAGVRLHLDLEEATWMEKLGQMADSRPGKFREWLRTAQEVFAFAVGDIARSISEEEIRSLPEVADASLRETFLGNIHGRQLLLTTFLAVMRRHHHPFC